MALDERRTTERVSEDAFNTLRFAGRSIPIPVALEPDDELSAAVSDADGRPLGIVRIRIRDVVDRVHRRGGQPPWRERIHVPTVISD